MRMKGFLAGLLLLSVAACDSWNVQEDVSATRVVTRPSVPIPPGSVPKGAGERAARLAAPGPAPTEALVARGRERFLAFCSPCHGPGGYGDGPVTQHGLAPPPSYHQQRLREAPPAHVVSVITNGFGRMYPYADRVPVEDRWAIAHYVKALQAQPPPPPQAPQGPVEPRRDERPAWIGIAPGEASP